MAANIYPADWMSSDDPAERFCARIQMCHKMIAEGQLIEAVSWIAHYRRDFYQDIAALGFRIH